MSKEQCFNSSLITHHYLSLITFFAWFNRYLVKHILPPESVGDAFGFVFGERMLRISAGNLEQSIFEHDDAKCAERDAGGNLYVAHVVYAKAPGLLDPILDERIAQGVFGFRFRQVCTFNDETVFASFIRLHGVRRKPRGLRRLFKRVRWNRGLKETDAWRYCDRCFVARKDGSDAHR